MKKKSKLLHLFYFYKIYLSRTLFFYLFFYKTCKSSLKTVIFIDILVFIIIYFIFLKFSDSVVLI